MTCASLSASVVCEYVAVSSSYPANGTFAITHHTLISVSSNSCIVNLYLSVTGIISTIAGTGVLGYWGDGGLATIAQIQYAQGLATDASGNLFMTDFGGNVIRMITASTGIITTVAGTGTNGGSGDGGQATSAQFSSPETIATDASGNFYVCDWGNHCIRKVTVSTGIITTVAGTNGVSGFSGDGGQATSATFTHPTGVAVDPSGNIYIADFMNQRVRMVTISTGIITTVAGTGDLGYSGDGGLAYLAEFYYPRNLAVDASGNIYINDSGNQKLRMVAKSSGFVTTLMSSVYPLGMGVTVEGNLYFTDTTNNYIRLITMSSGVNSIIAGTGVSGFSGDGGQAISAMLSGPGALALDPTGTVYIYDNDRIRVFSQYAWAVTDSPTASPTISPTASPTSPTFAPTTLVANIQQEGQACFAMAAAMPGLTTLSSE